MFGQRSVFEGNIQLKKYITPLLIAPNNSRADRTYELEHLLLNLGLDTEDGAQCLGASAILCWTN